MGGGDQTVNAGNHSVSGGGNGAIDAQHSRGSNSLNASGSGNGSMN
jgi:hypothetical protein